MARERREALELSYHIVPSAARDRRRVLVDGEDCTIFGYFATRKTRTMAVTLQRLSDKGLIEKTLKLPKGFDYRSFGAEPEAEA